MASWQPKRTTVLPKPDLKGAVVHLEGDPDSNGVLSDLSGNSSDGTISGKLSIYNTIEDIVYSSYGDGDPEILISDSAVINDNDAQTIQFFFNPRSNGESNEGRIFDKGAYYAYFDGTDINFHQGFSGTQGQWSFPVPQGFWSFVQITYDKSDVTNNPSAYVNGATVTVTENQAPVGTYTTDVGSDLYLFDRAANDRAFDGEISKFKLYPSVLSAGNLDDEYENIALPRVIRPMPRTEYAVTAAPVASPNQVGPWMTWNRSHEWLDDGSERYLKSSSNSNAYASIGCNHAYGARYYKYNLTALTAVGVISSYSAKPDLLFNNASQTGVMVFHSSSEAIQIYKMTGGGITIFGNSSNDWLPDDGSNIEIFETRRRTDGLFTVWTRESNHTTWTQAAQGTDNTYTTCNYCQVYPANNSSLEHYGFIIWPYGDSLTPNDVPFLAD